MHKKQYVTVDSGGYFVIFSSDLRRHVYVCKNVMLAYALHQLTNANIVCATNKSSYVMSILISRHYFATQQIFVFCENEVDALLAEKAAKKISANLLISNFTNEIIGSFLGRSR